MKKEFKAKDNSTDPHHVLCQSSNIEALETQGSKCPLSLIGTCGLQFIEQCIRRDILSQKWCIQQSEIFVWIIQRGHIYCYFVKKERKKERKKEGMNKKRNRERRQLHKNNHLQKGTVAKKLRESYYQFWDLKMSRGSDSMDSVLLTVSC
ncbi:hypothetical protein H1C71_027506 [Ictidomys tridecemlineatus]|nr:hypothetical protein H1C71_027506 [Ictidomys tridecemlineatus]